MPRKWRPILATVFVLGFAVFAYLHSSHAPIDLAAMPLPFDEERPALTDLPADIRKLDGKLVAVDGYMIPLDQAEAISEFALIPAPFPGDGPPPSITRTIVAHCQPTNYMSNSIRVYGRLHVRITTDEGYVISLYDMDVERIAPIYTGPRARWPWIIIGAMTVIAILFARRTIVRRHRRIRAGCCTRCGYDLRATPARCPECGLPTPVTIPA
jgi:hypothetical protein